MTEKFPEQQYLDLLRKLIEEGDPRTDRTGVGTRSLTGTSMRFDLSDGSIPLLTTKKVLWRAALVEMLWFLSGETNIRPLLLKGVHIWTDWPLASYRKATGDEIGRKDFEQRVVESDDFATKWGDLGPVYGAQWRKWPDGRGGYVDQIAECIRLLREDPYSRRILFHGWNVAALKDMALPPCHMVYQFTVTNGKVNLVLFQRSVDSVLGLPFNCCGAAFLLCMVAQQSNLEVGDLFWVGADTHIYQNHIEAAQEQLSRQVTRPFPKLMLNKKPSIDLYEEGDFEIVGYEPDSFIKAPVAV